jgi:hypothetical protein
MDFVNFRLMIAPVIVKYVIFWLGVLYAIIAAIGMMRLHAGLGILILIAGPLLVRIACELFLVLFAIHEELVKINRRAGDASTPFVTYQMPPLSQIAQAFAPAQPPTPPAAAKPAEQAPPPPDKPAP